MKTGSAHALPESPALFLRSVDFLSGVLNLRQFRGMPREQQDR